MFCKPERRTPVVPGYCCKAEHCPGYIWCWRIFIINTRWGETDWSLSPACYQNNTNKTTLLSRKNYQKLGQDFTALTCKDWLGKQADPTARPVSPLYNCVVGHHKERFITTQFTPSKLQIFSFPARRKERDRYNRIHVEHFGAKTSAASQIAPVFWIFWESSCLSST